MTQEHLQYVTKGKIPPLEGERERAKTWMEGNLPPSVVVRPLQEAMRSFHPFLEGRHRSRLFKEESDFFALKNGLFQTASLFLYIPPGLQCHEKISVASTALFPRVHLYVGRGAALSLHYEQGDNVPFFDVVLDEESLFSFYDTSASLQTVRATLKKKSAFHYLTAPESAPFSRVSLRVELVGEEAEATLEGLTSLKEGGERHIHTLVEHRSPSARSRQHFKTLLEGDSLSSFEGKIYVEPIAQKTESYQLASTLLLGEEARMRVKPNLEIFADDVKASHGATLGRLDAEALHYLRARGLSLDEAKRLLVEGFCREILEKFPQ